MLTTKSLLCLVLSSQAYNVNYKSSLMLSVLNSKKLLRLVTVS